jgi:hypothetical protein
LIVQAGVAATNPGHGLRPCQGPIGIGTVVLLE